jgi:hypothetical protein
MTNIVRRAFSIFFLAAGTVGGALAHEVLTHQNIGNVAVAYLQQSPQYQNQNRPLLQSLQQLLPIGAVQEDAETLPNIPFPTSELIGRYYFHFSPRLNFSLPGIGVSASCPSDGWGLNDNPQCTVKCIIPPISLFGFDGCDVALVPEVNNYRWSQVLDADSSGAPDSASIVGFGYVVHLLEDLGSPPHTRNDLHACPFGDAGLIYCDPFERDNDGAIPSLQVALGLPTGAHAVIPTSGFTTPDQFFQALQTYVSTNYYSNGTVFAAGLPGPCPVTGCALYDNQYFYGPCIPVISEAAGTPGCVPGQPATMNGGPFSGQQFPVRKVAHKGAWYWAFLGLDPTKAEIDSVIAQEQFAEVGPVIVQHLAAFIQFYAPALTVQVQGNGTVTSTNLVFPNANVNPSIPGTFNCVSGTCSALFVQGTSVTLTADPGSTVTWGGACSGNAATVTVVLTSDQTCSATFQPGSLTGDVISGSYDYPAFGVPYYAFSYSTNPVTVSPSGATTTFNINGGLPCCGQGTNFTVDFTANSLTVTVVSGGGLFCGCGSSFNGPVFTVTSPQSFPAVSSVSSNVVGFSGGVTANGSTIGINFQGVIIPNGSYVVVNFGP